MNEAQIMEFAHRAMYIASALALPILIICLAVGLIVSIFETATQIHEQALTFVPKLAAVVVLLAVIGNWMVTQLSDFMREVFSAVARL